LGNDTDPENDPLNAVAETIQSDLGATVTIRSDGSFDYDPRTSETLTALPEGQQAVDRFEYTVQDGVGGEDVGEATVTVQGQNDPPVAEDDEVDTDEDTAIDIDVLADNGNGADSDPDTGDQITLDVHDTISTLGATITRNADGTLHYDPTTSDALNELAVGEEVVDSFHYAVTDGSESTPGEVQVTVFGENDGPELAVIENVTLQAGSPLHIPLDGFDIDGDELWYEIIANDAPGLVSTSFPETGSLNMRVSVQDYGDLVYRLFENRVPSITDKLIQFVEEDAYDDGEFWRVINDFMIQAEGDPKDSYDDAFHVDLQHNSTGLLSLATPGTDDANGSGFFTTEGPSRHLDMNHSIAAALVEGEDVRAAISDVPVEESDRRAGEISQPIDPVIIVDATIEEDFQNEILLISAPEHSLGEANITVRVSDGELTAERTFHVDVIEDTYNSLPFLGPVTDTQGSEITTLQTTVGTPLQFVLTSEDVEGDAVLYDSIVQNEGDGTISTDSATGLTTYTPPASISGSSQVFQIAVGVRPETLTADQLQLQAIGMGIQDTQILEILVTAT
jgi:VCBS repeat-containing protein